MKFACLILLLFVSAGCAASSLTKEYTVLDPKLERESLYIVPFDATLVPGDFGGMVFNSFIDLLNAKRKQTHVGRFVILKEELKEVEPAWLIKQIYISGDIWGYLEKSGCCSTEMKIKSRIYLYEPGKNSPTFETFVPSEYYFEHDRGDISVARARLAKQLAIELADSVIKKLTP